MTDEMKRLVEDFATEIRYSFGDIMPLTKKIPSHGQLKEMIQRFATALSQCKDAAPAMSKTVEALTEENERLREALGEAQKVIGDYLLWFQAVKEHQEPLLMRGLKEAENNWDLATNIKPFDCSEMQSALTRLNDLQLGGDKVEKGEGA